MNTTCCFYCGKNLDKVYFRISMSAGHANEPSQCFLNVILWSPVQKLHDHHSVLWKEPIRRWWGRRRSLQNPDFIRLLQPGGPRLTPHSLFYLLHLFPLTKGPTTAEQQYVPLADSSGLTSLVVLAAVGTHASTSGGQTQSKASMFTFSLFNYGKCSDFYPAL